MPVRLPQAVRLAKGRQWDELVRCARGPDGQARATERDGNGSTALHWAAAFQAPLEVVRALLDAYPQGAQVTDSAGCLALHLAARYGAPVEVVRALLDAYSQGAQTVNSAGRSPLDCAAAAADGAHFSPKILVMLALAHAGYPPSRPWTPETCAALCATLRGIDLNPLPEARRALVHALIDEHLSRVRTLLLSLHRLGLPSALVPLLVGAVYTADILC